MPDWKLTNHNHVDLVDGRFARTTRADLEAALVALKARPAEQPLVVHFHGGLVSRAKAAGIAEELGPIYESAGGVPLFFNWNSDLVTTVRSNLDELAQERLFQRLLKKVAQWVFADLALDGIGAKGVSITPIAPNVVPNAPEDLDGFLAARDGESFRDQAVELTPQNEAQIAKDIERDPILQAELQALIDGPPTQLAATATIALHDPSQPGAKGILSLIKLVKSAVAIVARTIKRFIARRDHGLYPTIVEEIIRELSLDFVGRTVWSTMKQDTRDAFDPQDRQSGGWAFLELARQHWTPGRRLVLIGHSTGAIAIGNLLERQAATPSLVGALPRADVAFLAPAMTTRTFFEQRKAFAEHSHGVHLFGLSDALERGYWEFPGYRGSLLYLVSGCFEDEVDAPLVGMQRYFSGVDPYRDEDGALSHLGAWLPITRQVWSASDGGLGRSSGAREHGAFDEDPATRASLQHIIGNGLP